MHATVKSSAIVVCTQQHVTTSLVTIMPVSVSSLTANTVTSISAIPFLQTAIPANSRSSSVSIVSGQRAAESGARTRRGRDLPLTPSVCLLCQYTADRQTQGNVYTARCTLTVVGLLGQRRVNKVYLMSCVLSKEGTHCAHDVT